MVSVKHHQQSKFHDTSVHEHHKGEVCKCGAEAGSITIAKSSLMQSSEIIKVDENGKNLYKLTEIEKERMK